MARQPDFDDRNDDLIYLGSRGSPLALAQASEVARSLIAASGGMMDPPELRIITTSGDAIQDRPLSQAGGKGLFTKEIDEALLSGEIDLAVHSMKDLPTNLPPGIIIAAVLPREDPRDVLIGADSIAGLPPNARLGSSSLRRAAQVLQRRPDVKIVNLRGNVQTRLGKIEAGEADATLLALAGLHRLGLDEAGGVVLSTDDMLPAVAQGAIAIACRAADPAMVATLGTLTHNPTERAVAAERALLAALEGSCRTPIAALAEWNDGALSLRASIFSPDGKVRYDTTREGSDTDAERMGRDAGEELRKRAGPGFFNI